MVFQWRVSRPKMSFASSRLPNSHASDISPVVFARHHGLRSCDKRGEESVELFDVHRPAALREVPEAVNLGVGQRVVLSEGLHGEPSARGSICLREHSTRHPFLRAYRPSKYASSLSRHSFLA